MRLFHFSDCATIETFAPRPVQVASARPPGREWLNGPLVWAIDEARRPMYLFPRDCPRILAWPTERTTAEDIEQHWRPPARMMAFAEEGWRDRIASCVLYRYELPAAAFEDLEDAGMWVAREDVRPLGVERVDDLLSALADEDVLLQFSESLTPLKSLWRTSLHVSGIRLRNAIGWTG